MNFYFQSSLYLENPNAGCVFVCVSKHPPHLQDALLFALGNPFSGQDGEAVSADFVRLVAVIFKRHLIV